jgi:transcriptional regulator with XRE-family HTH domain
MTKLRECIEKKGVKQYELAKKMKVTTATICCMTRKGIYDTRTATRYAKALDVSPLFLLEGLGR